MLFLIFSLFAALKETLGSNHHQVKASDVWITMALGTVGLIVAIVITISCFREKQTKNDATPNKVDSKSLIHMSINCEE